MKEQLLGMEFTLTMDRQIEKDKHYISPGGYEMNGKKFDFMDYEGTVIGDNKIFCRLRQPDEDMEEITEDDIKPFKEFYVYTGEGDDEEINPVAISGLTFIFNDKIVKANSEVERSVNNILIENLLPDARLAEALLEEAAGKGGKVYTVYADNEEIDFIACAAATSEKKAKELTKRWIREFAPGEEDDTMDCYAYRMVITNLNSIGTELDRIRYEEIPDIRKWLEE